MAILTKQLKRNADLLLDWDATGVLWVASAEAGVRLSLPPQSTMLLDAFDGVRTVGEIVTAFGGHGTDANELAGFIAMLHAHQILIDDHFESKYFGNYKLGDHHSMLRDVPRMDTYRAALHELVGPETVVADLGAGTGILTLFACQAGAKHVYAVDGSQWIDVARQMAAQNGFSPRITFIRGKMEEVQLPEPVDLIVSECMDSLFIDARMLPHVIMFRDRWLKDGGHIIPEDGTIFFSPIQADAIHIDWMGRWASLKEAYGLDFTPLQGLAEQDAHRRLLPSQPHLAPPQAVFRMELSSMAPETPQFESAVTFEIERDGLWHGFAGHFTSQLSSQVVLSTAATSPATHWQQHYFPLPEIAVQQGDILACQVNVGPSPGNARRLEAEIQYALTRNQVTIKEGRQRYGAF
jgi:2-polyprenyl-3-methyl-5-hydroxy-6-metoxy-1,4-benzoquinol methylase